MVTDAPSIEVPGGEQFSYDGTELSVVMPQIRFISYKPGGRDADAKEGYRPSSRRRFMIAEDWEIGVRHELLTGRVSIPKETFHFDGASIPAHALVSFLSFGILRPLGVAFIPSLVHDYAYVHGGVRVDGTYKPLEREAADALFRDMFYAVYKGRPSFLGWAAWAAVRLGRFIGVEYNQKGPAADESSSSKEESSKEESSTEDKE